MWLLLRYMKRWCTMRIPAVGEPPPNPVLAPTGAGRTPTPATSQQKRMAQATKEESRGLFLLQTVRPTATRELQ